MRILYLQTFPLWGSGSGTYARHLASEIGKKHAVALLAPDKRTPVNTKLYTLDLPFKVAFTGHPEWKNCKLYKDIKNKDIARLYTTFLTGTIRAVEQFKPDLIHVHHAFPFSWAAAFVQETYGINFVVTIHGSELPTADENYRYANLTISALRRAKRIIPNSGWTKEWFLDIFKDDFSGKIRVIPGGVDIRKFRYIHRFSQINKRYNLDNENVVVFAGKLTRYKGVEYLIKAASKIDAQFLILGEGPERKKLESLTKKLGITRKVHFVGHLGAGVEKLAKYYSRADVFVAPSVWDEPLGLVILEAMACKTPVVVTRKGGIPLAVKDGVNGFFVNTRNASNIVQKVNMLLSDDAKRKKMGKNARRIVEERFSWEIIGKRFIRIYKSLF